MLRVISYIDGFNLYFGLRDKDWRKYYWLDLVAMSKALLKPEQTLVHCHYFTARIRDHGYGGQSVERQKTWLDALNARQGISCHFGHYLLKKTKCRKCGACWPAPEEKMTDVNIASRLIVDAYENKYDSALIVSADSDLATPIRLIQEKFPEKKLIVAFPPKRRSDELAKRTNGYLRIGADKLKNNLLPNEVAEAATQKGIVKRPGSWC